MASASCYDAYGRKVSSTGDSTDPFAFNARSGYYRDWETGGVYLCTNRYYDPIGRWETRDLIGYAGGNEKFATISEQEVLQISLRMNSSLGMALPDRGGNCGGWPG